MKYLILVCTIFSMVSSTLFAYPRHTQDVAHAVKTLYQCPEFRKLMQHVERDGPIQIRMAPFYGNSHAMWKGDERAIVLNTQHSWSEGKKIRSILFESHNALEDKHFLQIDQRAERGQLSKWKYIEQIEKLEHKNVMRTVSIIQKGIEMRIFPQDTYWAIEPNFQRHFRIQRESGHSQLIAQNYDQLRHRDHFARKTA